MEAKIQDIQYILSTNLFLSQEKNCLLLVQIIVCQRRQSDYPCSCMATRHVVGKMDDPWRLVVSRMVKIVLFWIKDNDEDDFYRQPSCLNLKKLHSGSPRHVFYVIFCEEYSFQRRVFRLLCWSSVFDLVDLSLILDSEN